MTIQISLWYLPALITAVAFLWPGGGGEDRFGIGAAFDFLLRVIIVMAIWLLYFIINAIF